jgi:hypothetical protein
LFFFFVSKFLYFGVSPFRFLSPPRVKNGGKREGRTECGIARYYHQGNQTTKKKKKEKKTRARNLFQQEPEKQKKKGGKGGAV